MQFMVAFRILGAVQCDLAHGMQHRGVVAAAEQLADFRQALLCQFLGQVHGDLAAEIAASRLHHVRLTPLSEFYPDEPFFATKAVVFAPLVGNK